MKKTRYNVAKRRKRIGKTNYRKRLKFIQSGVPRLVIRPSLNNTVVQLIEFRPDGDNVLVSASSAQLKKLGWKFHSGNIPSAYLTGLLLGKKAVDAKIKAAVLDIGLKTPTKGSRLFACLKGVIDAGLKVPFSEDILPSDDRISGKHIADFAAKAKGNVFSAYKKNNLDPSQLPKAFEDIKKKILVK